MQHADADADAGWLSAVEARLLVLTETCLHTGYPSRLSSRFYHQTSPRSLTLMTRVRTLMDDALTCPGEPFITPLNSHRLSNNSPNRTTDELCLCPMIHPLASDKCRRLSVGPRTATRAAPTVRTRAPGRSEFRSEAVQPQSRGLATSPLWIAWWQALFSF